jgi:hypothetical protein
MAEMLTAAIAREFLRYVPETGQLFWKTRDVKWFKPYRRRASRNHSIFVTCTAQQRCDSWNRRFAGKQAGNVCDGHVVVPLFGTQQAGRLIFLMMEGRWPEYVDHKDRDGLNNRWSNLREVTSSLNSRNRSLPSNNKTGVIGVHWDTGEQLYRAKIVVAGRWINLGRYAKLEDAVAARKEAERVYDFTEGHGGERVA